MKAVAIMIVRNEEDCLPRCLEHLGEQGLSAVVIDNDSTDGTRAILESFSPGVVEKIGHAPFDGTFRWENLLIQAHAMQKEIDADWFHLNSADELFNSDQRGERLIDAIRRVSDQGFTAINYDEFVFIPIDDKTRGEGKAFDRILDHYYFFAPQELRQMRTWRNVEGISNIHSGGHRLEGPGLKIYPANLQLRHYIALSAEHFRKKYGTRKFPAEELARGWHRNRVAIDVEHTRMPPAHLLKRLHTGDPWSLDRSEVWRRHFWEMNNPSSPPRAVNPG